MASDIGPQQLLVCLGCPRITGDSSGASSFLSGDQLFGRLMFLPLKISGKDSVVDPNPDGSGAVCFWASQIRNNPDPDPSMNKQKK